MAWIEVAGILDNQNIYSLCVFNNKLYGGSSPAGQLFEWNGIDGWTKVADQLDGQITIHALCAFKGKLYGGTLRGGKLFEWNETEWIEVADQYDGQSIDSLCVFNNKLYASTLYQAMLLEWDEDGAWIMAAGNPVGASTLHSLCVFNEKLYGTGDPTGKLYEFSGTEMIEVAPMYDSEMVIYSLCVFNNKLYGVGYYGSLLEWDEDNLLWKSVASSIGVGALTSACVVYGVLYSTAPAGHLLAWNGTDSWIIICDPVAYPWPMCVFNNKLYSGTIYGYEYGGGKLLEYTPLNADFTASPLIGYSPLTVDFTNLSSEVPTTWDWTFGDGNYNSVDYNPSHTYLVDGTYTVSLTINKDINTDIDTKADYIVAQQAPSDSTSGTISVFMNADFTSSYNQYSGNFNVHFTNLTQGTPTNYLWDFGDGYTSVSTNPVHRYATAGYYRVSLAAWRGSFDDTATGIVDFRENRVRHRQLSGPIRTGLYMENGRLGVKVTGGSWINLMSRDLNYNGPWQVSYTMDTPNASIPHQCVLGRSYASSLLVTADSVSSDRAKDYKINTERRTAVFYNEDKYADDKS